MFQMNSCFHLQGERVDTGSVKQADCKKYGHWDPKEGVWNRSLIMTDVLYGKWRPSMNKTHTRLDMCPIYLWGDGGDLPPYSSAVYQAQPSLPIHTAWTPFPEPPVQVQVQLQVNMIPYPHCSPSQVLVDALSQHNNTKVSIWYFFIQKLITLEEMHISRDSSQKLIKPNLTL